ncbi:MAG: TonB-dependent receptor [Bacteroidetes bacterium]|nr:MAG: TonB-dependent receptor [Bacteroidota bacterium]
MKKRMQLLCSTALLCLWALFSGAQQKTVSGKVVDGVQKPLSGVSITVKNKTTATATNAEGIFSLPAEPGDVLVFSFVGFAPMEQKVGNAGPLSITMQEGANLLNEVVVIGYGTTTKKDITGAVATISAKDFQRGAISTPEQMIAGKIAGVSIISNGGQPGAGSSILIRGGSSLSASNSPLIVIDGVPVDNGGVSGASNPLSFINPNDVESFTILKDASAAAIYGTRASNGVVIITTKKGKGGGLRVNFSSVNSLSQLRNKVDVLSADQIRDIVNSRGTAGQKAMLGTANTDWQDVIYQSAFNTDNNISISGGVKKLPYRLSLGIQKQTGILKTDELQRSSVALVLNPTFFDSHLKLDVNLKGSSQITRFANTGAIGAAVSFDPTQPINATTKPERFGGYYEWLNPTTATGLENLAGRNPLGLLEQSFNRGTPIRGIGNIVLDYKFHFLPELRANVNFGIDASRGDGTTFLSDSAALGYVAGGNGGNNNYYLQRKQSVIFESYLSYAKVIKSWRSKFDVLAGYSYNNYRTKNFNYPSYTARGVEYPNTRPAFPFDIPENTLIAFFGRANYSFKDRYLLTATLRRDGSSRFAPANRWGTFPSVALAWDVSDEPFLKSSKLLSSLKLRVSYGVTGQQDGIGNYDFLSYYALSSPNATQQFGNQFVQGFRPGGFYANRKWEQTATTNIALDYGFLNNRINGSIDVYVKNTTDLLNNIPQPAGTNFSAFIVANVGAMENRGVEFSINTVPVKRPNFTWNVDFNVTYNENKITNLTVVPQDPNYPGFPSGGIAGGIGGQFAYINAVGFSRSTFNLYKQVYGADGKPLEGVFEDRNEDGIINQADLYKGKSAIPRVFMGFSSSASYKKWSAGFVMRASLDNYVYNNIYSNMGTLNQITGNPVIYNASVNYLDTRFIGNSQQLLSDYYIQNGAFLRMDNISLGYDFGSITKKSKVRLRLNATAQNVFVITKYTGLDPEVGGGIDNNLYPRPRIYSLGINLDY